MEEYESLRSFLEHVALVMDAEQNATLDAVNIMTLHSAKGLEFETVFLPGWEEGLFPHQRALDEGGRSGLEEERRLAYVGLTRAKKNLHLWFVSNRRIHGLWQSTIPSRFLEELPEAHVEVAESGNSYGGYGNSYGGGSFASGRGGQGAGRQNPYGASRFDNVGADTEKSGAFSNTYSTPGWQRASQQRMQPATTGARAPAMQSSASAMARAGRDRAAPSTASWSAKSTVTRAVSHSRSATASSTMKFGNGNVAAIEGNKLTIDFDTAGPETRPGWVCRGGVSGRNYPPLTDTLPGSTYGRAATG